jgi:gliding motility-associated-like protein
MLFQLLNAQIDIGIIGYISFDSCTATINAGNTSLFGIAKGNPACECGVKGEALLLDGIDDYIEIVGSGVSDRFRQEDFSISFYFKPVGASGMQTLITKTGSDCSSQGHFAVRYDGGPRFLNVQMVDNSNLQANLTRIPVPAENCWNHVVMMRRSARTILYLNGQYVKDVEAPQRVNVQNSGPLWIGRSYCSQTDRFFSGMIDEVRIYNRALTQDEITELYYLQDKITTDNTRIFLGESVDTEISNTCASTFQWTPTLGVLDVNDPTTTLTPTETTTYRLSFTDAQNCRSSDTLNIVVIDPTTLDCDQVFLPKAFTPNGDGLNEVYGISNPEIFNVGDGEFISLEIFDRWGNQVFGSNDPNETWDGMYKGQFLNPGVLLYKVRYKCRDEEQTETGSLTIIR